MEDNKVNDSKLDFILIDNLIIILNEIFSIKQSKRSLNKIQVINYIFKEGDLPLKCRFRMMVDVFIEQYIETEKTESNIIYLKDKWVNIILIHCEFALTKKGEIYTYLENRIVSFNKKGLEVQKKRMLNKSTLKLNLHDCLNDVIFLKTPKFNILIECISDFNPKLALDILKKVSLNLYFLCYERCIIDSDINEILDSQKGVFNKKFGLIPRIKDFARYLIDCGINPFNLPETTIEELLAEHVIDKLDNIDNNIEKAKDKQQTLIDITPHQTLSIDTVFSKVEESKKDEIIDFVKDINPCIEFDKLFGSDIEDKIEIWNYMLFFKMIDKNGTYLSIGNNTIIRVFVVIMRKHFKLPIAKSVDELIRIFGIKLSISDTVRVRSTPEIELKEQEIIRLLNAFETKTLPFTYVD